MNPALAGAVLIAVFLAGSVPARAAPAGAEIHIGSSAALSGPAEALGRRFHAGAKALFDQVNQQGGIQGARLLLDLRDDAYEANLAEANTRAFADDARILALFGYVGTPTSRVALPYVRRAQLPFIGAYTGADILREPFDANIFNVRASYADEARELAKAMRRDDVKVLNVLYQADAFGRSGLEAMRQAAAQAGIAIAAIASVKRNSEIAGAELRDLVRDSRSDAIFMVSTYGTCAAFMKRAREQGYRGHFYTLSFAGLEPLREALGRQSDEVTVAQVVPDPEDRSVPVVAAYQDSMREAGDRHFDSISLEGYIAARVLVEGLRRARPPLTREALRRGMEALGALDLGGFRLQYGANAHAGSGYIRLYGAR